MAQNIKAGENFIIRLNLIDKAGDPLVIATSVTSIVSEVIQNGDIVETLTYPSANIRIGETTSQVEIEIIQATSLKFTKGDVTLKTTILATDSDFDTEGVQRKVDERIIAKVK